MPPQRSKTATASPKGTKSMQDRFFDALNAAVEAADFALTVNPAWANTGNAVVVMPGTFKTLAAFTYDFQSGYCSFKFAHYGPQRYVDYIKDGHLLGQFINEVIAKARGQATA